MMDDLVERVAGGIHRHLSRRNVMQYLDNEEDCTGIARAIIPIVLEEVERHLSAVQYDPAPYTALKHRLATLRAAE